MGVVDNYIIRVDKIGGILIRKSLLILPKVCWICFYLVITKDFKMVIPSIWTQRICCLNHNTPSQSKPQLRQWQPPSKTWLICQFWPSGQSTTICPKRSKWNQNQWVVFLCCILVSQWRLDQRRLKKSKIIGWLWLLVNCFMDSKMTK